MGLALPAVWASGLTALASSKGFWRDSRRFRNSTTRLRKGSPCICLRVQNPSGKAVTPKIDLCREPSMFLEWLSELVEV